jgi:ribosomal protein S18 acetylase RimI-like enzyme
MTTIRPATSNDVSTIAHVHVEAWQAAYRRGIIADEFLNTISEDERTGRWSEILERPEQATFVAVVEGHGIVGFSNGGPEREGREDYRGELYAIYILPECQGQGIGRQLVATLAQWLMDSGFDTMMVWVLAENQFRRFYERLGGKLVGKKEIEIGNQKLVEVAYGWDDLVALIERRTP